MTVATFPDTRLTLGFLCPHNPHDRRAFSGTSAFAARALARRPGVEMRLLGAHAPPRMLDRLLQRPSPILQDDPVALDGAEAVIGLVATKQLNRLLDQHPGLPVFHVTDATPAFLAEAYGWAIPESAFAEERRLAARAARVIYSSPEMAARAPLDLELPGLRPAAAAFGVNFETLPGTCPEKPVPGRLELLFVGLDWVRKGGDIAVATLSRLRDQGIDAHLTIVGRCPERHWRHPDITYTGFLSKNRVRDVAALTRLYTKSHLLLAPSRSDCTPMVLAEAMAHGTPVVATETGGIASLLGGAGTGRLLPPYASPGEWAATIRSLMADRDGYRLMSDAAFERGRAELSWEAWADRVISEARMALMPKRVALRA